MEPEKVKIQGSLKCAAINTKVFQRRFLKLKKKKIAMNPGAPSRVGHTGYMWVYLERVSGGRVCAGALEWPFLEKPQALGSRR